LIAHFHLCESQFVPPCLPYPPHFANEMWMRSKWESSVIFHVRSTSRDARRDDTTRRRASWFSIEWVCEKYTFDRIITALVLYIYIRICNTRYLLREVKAKLIITLVKKANDERAFEPFLVVYVLRDSVVL